MLVGKTNRVHHIYIAKSIVGNKIVSGQKKWLVGKRNSIVGKMFGGNSCVYGKIDSGQSKSD